jgi:hypothetical protein
VLEDSATFYGEDAGQACCGGSAAVPGDTAAAVSCC